MKPLLQTIGDLGSRRGREEMQNFALRIGEAMDGAITDYLRHDLAPGKLQRLGTQVLRRTGFLMVERFNRRFSAGMARHWFFDLQTKAKLGDVIALRQLKRFGVDPRRAVAGQLTDRDLQRFAQNFVTETQIRLTPEQLPLASNNEYWRTAMQFKTFGLKAVELMLRDIETQGLARPLLRGTVAAGTVGPIVAIARRLSAGRAPVREKEAPYELPVEALLSVGMAGLFFDAIQAIERGQEAEFIGGPSVGLAQDVGRLARDVATGDIRGVTGGILKRVPVVGPAARRGFMEATKPTPPRSRRSRLKERD
jgi:hypothetical protein